ARMLAMPEATFFAPFALMIFLLAASSASNSAAVGATGTAAGVATAASTEVLPVSSEDAGAPAFFGVLAALPSAAAFGLSGDPPASVFASFLGVGFLESVASAINENQLMDTGLCIRIALHADRLAGSLASTGIRLSALAPHREPAQVSNATITFDGLQSFQVQTNFAAQITFRDIFSVLNRMHDLRQLLFV